MVKYILISIISGVLFGVMDGIINANPYARKLFEVYKPITKIKINAPIGMIIDLIYGFVMAGLFLVIYTGLPGETGLLKGLSFAGIAWFFRVVMSVASSFVMYNIPIKTLAYSLLSGLGEMLILGILFGLTLRP
jgi:hypothetical protein